MKPKIMFVNDSIKVLESLKWFFNNSTYHFFGCEDPFEALDNEEDGVSHRPYHLTKILTKKTVFVQALINMFFVVFMIFPPFFL